MDVDAQQRSKAIDRFVTLGGLAADAAGELVDAAVAAAVDHAFELVNGAGAVPTQMAAAKADQLRFVCERARRIVSQREVEILFRVPPSTARTILTTMRATYEQALRDKFVASMKADAVVTGAGNEEDGLTWVIRFTEPGAFATAVSELPRAGLASVADVSASRRTITVPRRVDGPGGKKRDALAALGLTKPGS